MIRPETTTDGIGGSIHTVKAEGWTHLMEELYRDNWDERIRRFRSPFVFRGADVREADLQPGLSKLARRSPEIRLVEGHLLRNFRKYATAEFPASGFQLVLAHVRSASWATHASFRLVFFAFSGVTLCNGRSRALPVRWCGLVHQPSALKPIAAGRPEGCRGS